MGSTTGCSEQRDDLPDLAQSVLLDERIKDARHSHGSMAAANAALQLAAAPGSYKGSSGGKGFCDGGDVGFDLKKLLLPDTNSHGCLVVVSVDAMPGVCLSRTKRSDDPLPNIACFRSEMPDLNRASAPRS